MGTKTLKWFAITALLLAAIWPSPTGYYVLLGFSVCVVALWTVHTSRTGKHLQEASSTTTSPKMSIRSIAISISLALVSAAPLIGAQDVNAPEARASLQPPAMIQELALQRRSPFGSSLQADSISAPTGSGQDLSRYREFQLGTGLLAVANQAGMKASDARVIHQRPALIQELQWRPLRALASPPQASPVKEILFSFYNGELFRMVVSYDQYRTEGLADEDMIETISMQYGAAARPAATVVLFSSFQVFNDHEKVIARWEDAQYSFDLFRSSYQPSFGILVRSKELDALAQSAIAEALHLDEQEAPQREIDRQKKQDAKDRAEQEKARLANKPNFRP